MSSERDRIAGPRQLPGVPRTNDGRVLFVAHECTRTGAPIVLLQFLRWLREATTTQFDILIDEPGPLSGEFAALAPTFQLERRRRLFYTDVQSTIARRFHVRGLVEQRSQRRLHHLLKHFTGYSAVYLNTAMAAEVLEFLPRPLPPVIAHLHEFPFSLTHDLSPAGRVALETCGAFITVCRRGLTEIPTVLPFTLGRLELAYEFIDVTEVADSTPAGARRQELRAELGLAQSTHVVGGVGSSGWRKGTDLFILLAQITRALRPDDDVHFLWIGGSADSNLADRLRFDVHAAGLDGHVSLVPTIPDRFDYFALFDVLALTSREDPFPLVCLEAAAMGIPTVTFDQGGMPEFVADDAGVVVPYLDVLAMASAVSDLIDDPLRRERLGAAATARVRDHHDLDVGARALSDILTRHRRRAPHV